MHKILSHFLIIINCGIIERVPSITMWTILSDAKRLMKKKKLIMTLLARDEEDVIEDNICFHLNHGVDYILAIDNNSQDGTSKIFEKYAKKGVLSFETVKENTHEQSKWVSAMAKKAVEKYGATHLFHSDADEFWYPESGNLKSGLPKKGEVFYVSVKNYLPERVTSSREKARMIVDMPFEYAENKGPDRSYRMFLYSYPPKVMTTSEFTHVWQGNHLILDDKPQRRVDVNHIFIHHFPIRSYKQFVRKTIYGGSAYEKNPDQTPELGWHKKEWYRFYKAGLLESVYNEICINSEERKLLSFNGVIKQVEIPDEIVHAKDIYSKENVKNPKASK